MSEPQEKREFMARWGDAEHVDTVIRMAEDVPQVRLTMKNPVFDREHHETMLNHQLPWVRHLAVHSPHVTTEDLSKIIDKERAHPDAMNNAMQHPKANPEDIKRVAMNHHNAKVKEGAVRIYHSKVGWTPEDLHLVAAGNPSPNIPMAIWNSTLPKDHPPITHNDIVKAHGGTLK
jgi:hypothetical protein